MRECVFEKMVIHLINNNNQKKKKNHYQKRKDGYLKYEMVF